MAYNHGREDRKWRIWKEAEEKVLRECGVDEATIEQIRTDAGRILIPTGGFTVGQATFGSTLREWRTGSGRRR